MKQLKFLILALILTSLFFSCQKTNTLSQVKKEKLVKDIMLEYEKFVDAENDKNYESYSRYFSEEGFISYVNWKMGIINSNNAWQDSLRNEFEANIENKKSDYELEINVLDDELAIVTRLEIWEKLIPDTYRNVNSLVTLVWKKEQETWKIIYVHAGSNKFEIK